MSKVVVRTCPTLHEAECTRAQLESAGLDARVEDGGVAGVNPWMTGALGGVRVVVPTDQAELAQEVLDEAHEHGDAPEPGEAFVETAAYRNSAARGEPDPVTPSAEGDLRRATNAALVGLCVLPVALHLYSAYTLLRIDYASLRPPLRTRWALVLALDLAVLVAVAAWFLAAQWA